MKCHFITFPQLNLEPDAMVIGVNCPATILEPRLISLKDIKRKSLIKSNIILSFCENLSWGKRKRLRVHSSCYVTARTWVGFLSIHMNMDNSSMYQEYQLSCSMMEGRAGESPEAHGPDDLQYITTDRLCLKQDGKQRPTPEGII